MKFLVFALAFAGAACGPASYADEVPEYTYDIVHEYPHDTHAFTEGLLYLNGFLYESTGEYGLSDIRKVRLETGEVLQRQPLAETYFGEGIVNWNNKLFQLTWQSHIGFIYDLESFSPHGHFKYPGEGWSLTQDGKRILMSDGTAQIRFWNPDTLSEIGRITITDAGKTVTNLNELEWVNGELFANIWQTDRIARIDVRTGKVTAWVDLAGLLAPTDRVPGQTDVLNGIAYDAAGARLFVTGKRWPKLFQIRLRLRQ